MIRPTRGPVAYGHHRGVAIYRLVKDDNGASHFYYDVPLNDEKRRAIALSLSHIKKPIDAFIEEESLKMARGTPP